MTDSERLDWLEGDSMRLEDVRGWMDNEEHDVRKAIDTLAED